MQAWQQLYTPLGSLGLSAAAAVIPIVFFFLALAVFRLKGHIAGSITLALAIAVAIFAFHMPADMAFAAAGYGFLYGLWPIAWIIVAAVFLYKLTVKSGQFALTLFLKVWQPQGASEALAASGGAAVAGGGFGGQRSVEPSAYSFGEILKAWSPFLVLTVLVTIWTLKPFKALFAPGGELYWLVFNFAIPHLDQLVVKGAPIATSATPIAAVFKFDPISATGTAIFLSALVSMFILRIGAKIGITTFKEVLVELKWPILSIGMVLAFAFVTNYSGMSTTLALVLAGTGAAFPFFSPFLGWLGVFLTGSDTSSNALFSSLQSTTAHQIGVSDTLLVAANTSGGVTGKMISPQSIAVACAATGMVGKESDLFRFTLKHSLIFAALVGLITLAQAYLFTGMLVH